MRESFEELVDQALRADVEGWDIEAFFAWRYEEQPPPWDLRSLARERLEGAEAALDLGTGGGEFLRGLAPLPPRTVATEGHPPNVDVARRDLEPLGVDVAEVSDESLPVDSEAFDVVIARHEGFDPAEVRRVLRPGGVLVTQQVGGADLRELNDALDAPPHAYRDLDLAGMRADVERAGLDVVQADEAFPPARFGDIGACVLFLRLTPWQIPGFAVEAYEQPLRDLDTRMRAESGLDVTTHRLMVVAQRGDE